MQMNPSSSSSKTLLFALFVVVIVALRRPIAEEANLETVSREREYAGEVDGQKVHGANFNVETEGDTLNLMKVDKQNGKESNQDASLEDSCFTPSEDGVSITPFPTTIVTGFFEMGSKHSASAYDKWITNFMLLETPVIVFTDKATTAAKLSAMRPKHLHNLTYICIVSLYDLDAYVDFGHAVWKQQFAIDPEKEKHKGYPLYLVWLGKVEFVLKAARRNIFQSEFFMWNDIGGFRSDRRMRERYQNVWPKISAIREFCSTDRVTIMVVDHYFLDAFCGLGNITNPETFKGDKRYNLEQAIMMSNVTFTVAGSPQCGTPAAFERYYLEFRRLLRIFIESGTFAGKDQTIMATLALSRPELVHLVQPRRRDWFFFNELLRHNGSTSEIWPKHQIRSCANQP